MNLPPLCPEGFKKCQLPVWLPHPRVPRTERGHLLPRALLERSQEPPALRSPRASLQVGLGPWLLPWSC